MRALVVIDMQEKYLGSYDNELLSSVNKRIKLTHEEEDVPIFYVVNVGMTGNRTGYELSQKLLRVSDLVYEKRHPSAFSSKEFADKMSALNVTELEFVGIDGASCVAKTAIDAVKRGYKAEIVKECIGARNDKLYEKTLKKLEGAGVNIL